MSWVDVRERLPESMTPVLCFLRGNNTAFPPPPIIAVWFGEYAKFATMSGYQVFHTVTHWQPLPEPPAQPPEGT